ncbi:MAG: hypothetical protein HPY68_03240 [Candidatus Atribacteria bacterium]|nr:hypothetical protein [Candidatus Atribacteria bacterium]
MFLDRWLVLLEQRFFFLALAGYVALSIGIGVFSWQWRKWFFFFSSFLLLFFGMEERVHGHIEWLAMAALGVALLVTFWHRAEKLGQFFLGCWIMVNFFSLLFLVSREVELIRFLVRVPIRVWFIVAVVCGVLSLYRYFLHLFSALLGSALLMAGYLKVIIRSGFEESFWGEPPFLTFLFLVFTIFLYALRECE